MHEGFDQFWSAYPRRIGKLAASREWDRKKPPIADVLAALEWQVQTWGDPRYIPHPRTWISQGRWMDEPPTVTVKADDYGHLPPCASRTECIRKVINDGRRERGVPELAD